MGDKISENTDKVMWYKKIFETNNDMILFYQKDGHIVEYNESVKEHLGYENNEELYIQDIFRLNFASDNEVAVLIEGEYRKPFETVAYCMNQTCSTVDVRFIEPDIENNIPGLCMCSCIDDIHETERKLLQAKKQAEDSQKERNEFVANVTHELRTPVNGIMGLSQNLLSTELKSDQKDDLRIIFDSCQKMIKIINNILDFSKIEAGKFTIENRKFRFADLFNNVVGLNSGMIESKQIEFIYSMSPDIPEYIVGDELRINQILNNLLSNATKFTESGKIILDVIKSADKGKEIELFFMVSDTGIGVSKEEKDKLFKEFSQVDASITRRFGGTGLGLSIVKSLVEMMGGRINVESNKGEGSTFSFYIIVGRAEEGEPETTDAVEGETHATSTTDTASQNDKTTDAVNAGISKIAAEPSAYTSIVQKAEAAEVHTLTKEQKIKMCSDIKQDMEKLILCIELENWNKAEIFASKIKENVTNISAALKSRAFRLVMTIRRSDYEASVEEYEILNESIDSELAGWQDE